MVMISTTVTRKLIIMTTILMNERNNINNGNTGKIGMDDYVKVWIVCIVMTIGVVFS